MADNKLPAKQQSEVPVKDYAGGWITEKKGTDVPGFLKLAFPIIGLGGTAYLVLYMNGEQGHAERGPLVKRFVDMTSSADSLMYFVALLAFLFVICVVMFAFGKSHQEH
jgi:hypothetical protein